MDLNFKVEARCGETQARLGRFRTTHNEVETPQFMPVGTMASVKGVDPDTLVGLGATVILGNTYHLGIRPGVPVLEALGGMHTMAHWGRSILTDSGGFQILSLAKLRKIDEDGVKFRNHVDGALLDLTPERSIAIQAAIGSDIAMCLDHLAASDAPRAEIEAAMARTTRWAARCLEARTRPDQALFAIVQGGIDLDLRSAHVDALGAMPFDGYALGGLAVGEPIPDMDRTVEHTAPRLPADKPRYLMGVGTPRDLVESVARGVDMFDCVMPTRNARKGGLFVDRGRRKINLNNARFRMDAGPLDPGCACPACTRFSAGYLRHLLVSKELLAYSALSVHNLHVYLSLMAEMRQALRAGQFAAWRAEWRAGVEG
jgi:queuine tRNA-ribosyltransferase